MATSTGIPAEPCGDPRVAWASEVAAGRTVLGLKDWMAARATQATQECLTALGRWPNKCCMEARLEDSGFLRRFPTILLEEDRMTLE